MDEDGSSVRLRLVADVASPTQYSVNISLTDSDAICKYLISYDYVCTIIMLKTRLSYPYSKCICHPNSYRGLWDSEWKSSCDCNISRRSHRSFC